MDIGDDILDRQLGREEIIDRVIDREKYLEVVGKGGTKEGGIPDSEGIGVSDRLEEEIDLAQEIKQSINLRSGQAPNLFGGELGKLLNIAAANFNVPTHVLNFCLLPVLGSQIDSQTRLLINPGTNYKVPAIRWCGLVGDTGSKKSPILGLLTNPIGKQQSELYQAWKANKEDYEREYRSWKNQKVGDRGDEPEPPAPMRDLYFDSFTIEGIIKSLADYPDHGYLVNQDELAQFFGAMDMYRSGKGNDRQLWLKIWNGDGIKSNRKSADTIVIPQSSISILGGIQPQTITNLLAGDKSDRDGLWNRFSFMNLPHNKTEAFTETPADLGECLGRVYKNLSNQESDTHYLSVGAKEVWKRWHDAIEDRTIAESHWLVKGALAKFEGIAGRNALILHRTLAAIEGVKPSQQISAEVMGLAIAWTQFELNQTLSQYQLLEVDDGDPDLARILKFIDRFEGKGWVSARDVYRWWSTRPVPPTSELREFMAKVVSLGYAIDNGESPESKKYQIQVTKPTPFVSESKVVSVIVEPIVSESKLSTSNSSKELSANVSDLEIKNQKPLDAELKPEIKDAAAALEVLAAVEDEEEALEALGQFYTLWSAEDMRVASGLLKRSHPQAFDRVLALLKIYKSRHEEPKVEEPTPPKPQIVKVNDRAEYQINGDRVDWIEITFEKMRDAKEWDKRLLLMGQTLAPHKIKRQGKELWLVCGKGIDRSKLDGILKDLVVSG